MTAGLGGLVATGVLGMFLTQTALNAGQLIAAQPGLTLSDPLICVLWGVTAFHEQIRQGYYILGEVPCAGMIITGVIMLARSPLLSENGSAGKDQSQGGSPVGHDAKTEPRHSSPNHAYRRLLSDDRSPRGRVRHIYRVD
jgi:hypothetical protein